MESPETQSRYNCFVYRDALHIFPHEGLRPCIRIEGDPYIRGGVGPSSTVEGDICVSLPLGNDLTSLVLLVLLGVGQMSSIQKTVNYFLSVHSASEGIR